MGSKAGTAPRRWSSRTTVASRARASGPADPFPDLRLIDFRKPWLISLFFGLLGADRFYLRRPLSGFVKLLTLGGAGLWWAADVLALASGVAVDGGGHPLAGRPGHRTAALVVSAAVIGGTFGLAAGPVLTAVQAGAGNIIEGMGPAVPARQPGPPWTEVAVLAGGPGSEPAGSFTITSDLVRITYLLDGPGFIYLLPAGAVGVPAGAGPDVSALEAGPGERILRSAPGERTLVVQPQETTWSATVEQLGGADDG